MIEIVLEKLSSLVGPILDLTKDRRELKDNALRTISHALNETYLYYRKLELGKVRDHDIEAQLSKYWSAAAIPIRHIDPQLAQLCEQKSDYWVNPDRWDQKKVRKIGIGLEQVRKRYRTLLSPRFKSVVSKNKTRKAHITSPSSGRAKSARR